MLSSVSDKAKLFAKNFSKNSNLDDSGISLPIFPTRSNTDNTDESLIHLKSKIKDIGLSSLRFYNKKDHKFDNLTKEECEAFLNLKNNKNIIIQKLDKGNSVVVNDRHSYINKMEKFLGDTSKFVKIEFNRKHKVNKEIRHLLLDDDYKFLKPCGSKPGVMYGLCKVHKGVLVNDPVPQIRPILSAIGTCSYNIAKFFVPILKQFTINEYTVKDSFSFCKEIIDQNPNLYMASFDVQSLFTNIPLDETINICVDMVYNKRKKVKGMLKRHFRQLLMISVKSSCFLFNDVYYKQIDGVAMGSPLGPTLANLFLVYHERKWLDNCPLQFHR